MNNSDQSLSSFDEKLTAYIDGQMSDAEAAAFEREHPEAAQERNAAAQLGAVLKRGSAAPALRNAEFFNRQILRQITPAGPREVPAEGRPGLFNLWRLVFAGAFCILAGLGIYHTVVRSAPTSPPYLAQVLSVKTGDASLTTRLIHEEGLTLVMIDGLEPMSEEFILN